MLSPRAKPVAARARRHNRFPVTGYFLPEELPKLEVLARHLKFESISDLLRNLVNTKHSELATSAPEVEGEASK